MGELENIRPYRKSGQPLHGDDLLNSVSDYLSDYRPDAEGRYGYSFFSKFLEAAQSVIDAHSNSTSVYREHVRGLVLLLTASHCADIVDEASLRRAGKWPQPQRAEGKGL